MHPVSSTLRKTYDSLHVYPYNFPSKILRAHTSLIHILITNTFVINVRTFCPLFVVRCGIGIVELFFDVDVIEITVYGFWTFFGIVYFIISSFSGLALENIIICAFETLLYTYKI